MFGIPISDGTLFAEGTKGYVVAFSLLTQLPNKVSKFQIQDSTLKTMSSVIKTEADEGDLFDYQEAALPPKLAFSTSEFVVYVFFNKTDYPLDAGVPDSNFRIVIWYFRNATKVANITDKLDIPPESKELLKQNVIRKMYTLLKKPIPFKVLSEIKSQKKDLSL